MANKTLHLPPKAAHLPKKPDPLESLSADEIAAPAPVGPPLDEQEIRKAVKMLDAVEPPQRTLEEIKAMLEAAGFVITKKLPDERADIKPDPTEHIPTAPSNPFDLSKLPPPGERNSSPVQVPARAWGNPRLLAPSAPPGPQPTHTPPKGR